MGLSIRKTYSRDGVTRIVFLFGKYAFKFPQIHSWNALLLGLLGNMNEHVFGQMKSPLLCPILAHLPGGFLIVMRRAESVKCLEPYRARVDEIREAFPFIENKTSSFGLVDGVLVAVDYG